MAKGFQVLEFVLLDFGDGWSRFILAEAIIEYTAVTDAGLSVVQEGETGVAVTYQFRIAKGDVVLVSGDVVHVPERCVGQDPGNTVKCG